MSFIVDLKNLKIGKIQDLNFLEKVLFFDFTVRSDMVWVIVKRIF